MCSFFVVFFTTYTTLTDINGLTKNIVIFTTRPKFLLISIINRFIRHFDRVVQKLKKSCTFHRPVFLLLVRFGHFLNVHFCVFSVQFSCTFPHSFDVKNTTLFLLTLAFWRFIIEVAFE